MINAILFDLDGTLLDTNTLHVGAWVDALEEHHYRVGRARIEQEIGKGGDLFVEAVLGCDAEEQDGDALRESHGKLFAKRLAQTQLSWLRGARAVLELARARGRKTAIATSSSPEALELLEKAGDFRFSDLVDVVTTKEDAEASKPSPDVLVAACEKLGEDPLACLMVGDALHDAAAARRAGLAFVGTTTGFIDRAGFVRAGARFIVSHLDELVASFDEALSRASSLSIGLDRPKLDEMLGEALEDARMGLREREVPVGAALYSADGRLLARGHNKLCATGDRTHHAESDAFRNLPAHRAPKDEPAILVCTLEPCVMCLGSAMELGIDVVVYGLEAPEDGGVERVSPPLSSENLLPRIRGGIEREPSRDILVAWMKAVATPAEVPFVEALLRATENGPKHTKRSEDAA